MILNAVYSVKRNGTSVEIATWATLYLKPFVDADSVSREKWDSDCWGLRTLPPRRGYRVEKIERFELSHDAGMDVLRRIEFGGEVWWEVEKVWKPEAANA